MRTKPNRSDKLWISWLRRIGFSFLWGLRALPLETSKVWCLVLQGINTVLNMKKLLLLLVKKLWNKINWLFGGLIIIDIRSMDSTGVNCEKYAQLKYSKCGFNYNLFIWKSSVCFDSLAMRKQQFNKSFSYSLVPK